MLVMSKLIHCSRIQDVPHNKSIVSTLLNNRKDSINSGDRNNDSSNTISTNPLLNLQNDQTEPNTKVNNEEVSKLNLVIHSFI